MKPILLISFLFYSVLLHAQQFPGEDVSTRPEQTPSPPPQTATEQPAKKGAGFFEIFSGKPGKAALYSLLVPGAGQIYNKRYWKLPLVYAAEGTALYFLLDNRNRYRGFRDAYVGMLNGDIDSYLGLTQASDVRIIRDSYRKDLEVSWIIMVLVHLLNVFEAFIDRHLMEFDVSEDLSLSTPQENSLMIQPELSIVHIRIPLSGKSLKKEVRFSF